MLADQDMPFLCRVCVAGNGWLRLRVATSMYKRSFIPSFSFTQPCKGECLFSSQQWPGKTQCYNWKLNCIWMRDPVPPLRPPRFRCSAIHPARLPRHITLLLMYGNGDRSDRGCNVWEWLCTIHTPTHTGYSKKKKNQWIRATCKALKTGLGCYMAQVSFILKGKTLRSVKSLRSLKAVLLLLGDCELLGITKRCK